MVGRACAVATHMPRPGPTDHRCPLQDGSKVQLMRRWQPDVWPDYARLPLPPAAEERQFAYQVAVAAAEAQAAEAAGEPPPGGDVSPWYETYDPAYWATQGFPPEPLRPAQAAAAAAAAAGQRMAAAAAQMAQQRLMQQQLRARGQSTAAAAEADEFDAGLLKEAAGERALVLNSGESARAFDRRGCDPAAEHNGSS